MAIRWRGALALVLAAMCAGWGGQVLAHGAPISGRVTLDPGAPVVGGTLTVQVELIDASARPVTGARADVTVFGADRKALANANLPEQPGGIYVGAVQLPGTAGPYQLLLHAIAGASHWSADVDLTVAPAADPAPAPEPAPAAEPAAPAAGDAAGPPADRPPADRPPAADPPAAGPQAGGAATGPAERPGTGEAASTDWIAAPHLPSGPFPVPAWAAVTMLAALAGDAGLRLWRRRTG